MAKDLLLEIGTEEIPARFMPGALEELKERARNILQDNQISFNGEEISTIGTARRLVLHVPEVEDVIKQPVLGPPKKIALDDHGNFTRAAQGFAKSQNVSIEDLNFIDGRLGFVKVVEGEAVKKLLAEVCKNIIEGLSFPKNMRWGTGDFKFVRPIHWIVALFGEYVIDFEVAGVKSSDRSQGHRFLNPESFELASADLNLYKNELRKRQVIVDQDERKKLIEQGIDTILTGNNLFVQRFDKKFHDLLDEVNYLVEYPNPILGRFDSEYLDLPVEVLINVLHKHQKYFELFELVDKRNLKIAPFFIVVSNVPDNSNGIIRNGNERVIRARLSDAQFFYDEDKKTGLSGYIEGLKGIVFQKDLGTYYDKKERVKKILHKLWEIIPLNKIDLAADLYKADLLTEMVQEFPELQGIMGRYYALIEEQPEDVAYAIIQHYMPRYAGDELPNRDLGAALSIVDKLDTIVGCFGVGLIPSGSQDPYALRRQAFGIINILLSKTGPNYRLSAVNLKSLVENAIIFLRDRITRPEGQVIEEVLEFFRQRIHYALVEKDYRYDLVDAAIGAGFDSPFLVEMRCKALQELQGDVNWEPLVIAFKRVARIIPLDRQFNAPDTNLFQEEAEKELYRQFCRQQKDVEMYVSIKNYSKALKELAALRPAVDKFFDDVMVMCEDIELQNNRLALLNTIADSFKQLADFSQIVTQIAQ